MTGQLRHQCKAISRIVIPQHRITMIHTMAQHRHQAHNAHSALCQGQLDTNHQALLLRHLILDNKLTTLVEQVTQVSKPIKHFSQAPV